MICICALRNLTVINVTLVQKLQFAMKSQTSYLFSDRLD